MECKDYLSFTLYYGRQKLYFNMHKMAVDGLLKFPHNQVFALLDGFAHVLGDRRLEAETVFIGLKAENQFSLASIVALNYMLKTDQFEDEQICSHLENYFQNEENNCHMKANAFYYAALFYFLSEDFERAEKIVDEVLVFEPVHEASLILKAWLQLRHFASMNKLSFPIDFVLKQEPHQNMEATFCRVQYLKLLHEYDKCIGQLNIISIRYPEISIPLVEKLQVQLTTYSWEQAQETTLRIINLEPQNIMALVTRALLGLCRENNVKLALHVLRHLLTATDIIEHGNHVALLHICQLFARICSRHTPIIRLILHTLNKLDGDYVHGATAHVDYLNEIAQQRLLLGEHREAETCFQNILCIDGNNMVALCGLTQCQLMLKPTNIMALKQQIEFISKLAGNLQPTSSYLLLCAKMQQLDENRLPLLIEAAELHLLSLKGRPYGIEYLRKLNADLLIDIALQLLLMSPAHFLHNQQSIVAQGQTFHIAIKHCICLLEAILRACPAHLHANFLRAVVHLLCCENLHALQVIETIMADGSDGSFIDAQLLLAHINMQQGHYERAKDALDLALSRDLTIREHAIYHLLVGKVQRQYEQFAEAKKSFITALHIVNNNIDNNETTTVKDTGLTANAVHFSALFNLKTDKHKIMLYLEVIYTLRDLQDFMGSERYMQNAMEEFYGTREEGQLLIAQAKFFLQDFNYTKALNLLNSIKSHQPYYLQSKICLADIYLKYCKNRVLFAKCFKEIVELRPEMDSFLMLGEAYLAIQEPELAIETYRKAFEWSPSYTLLASKLGHAYVKTHQYAKAIKHYETVLAHTNNKTLKIDLTDLYLLLKQYKNAEKSLKCDLQNSSSQIDDNLDLEIRTRELLLLAHVQEKLNNIPDALKVLQIALIVQKNSTSKAADGVSARICLISAQLYTRIGALPQAENCYQECLQSCPSNVPALLGLAQLYMQMNSMELCSDICKQLLLVDPANQAAAVMLADILFHKMEFDKAVQHFSSLLRSQPHYWMALVRLIQIMHRLDQILNAREFLKRAEQLPTEGNKNTSGMIYCLALYNWYSCNLDGALKLFNRVRRDLDWGQQATSNMIEIYLNLDENIYYSYDNDSYNFNDIEDDDVNATPSASLNSSESLLKKFRPRLEQANIETYNLNLLSNLLLITSNQEGRIKKALLNFHDMQSSQIYPYKVGVLFGTALAHLKLKEMSQAKNLLKSVTKIEWNFEECEYLERCWLLLAYIYLQEHKLESALHFLDRILTVNKSHIKANELAGFITEKCETYANAVSYYSKAWQLCAKSKPYIGYKLAYCYMKLQKNADALNVCQQVLKLHPDFHVIKQDLLKKCRSNLRT